MDHITKKLCAGDSCTKLEYKKHFMDLLREEYKRLDVGERALNSRMQPHADDKGRARYIYEKLNNAE